MSGQNWTITIVSGTSGTSFVPDVFGSTGSELQAQNGDVISWNNQTNQQHQPYQANSSYQPTGPQLCDVVQSFASSTPGYVPNTTVGATIYYVCKIHNNERGTIKIVA
ncbi:MAG TPA: hypothetical protein VLC46_06990 [Thermoanaerobaculia bacterium]|jgi:hypothetical protein|nr:hypothetical protein [Thermoanaerobaculia bacterium]